MGWIIWGSNTSRDKRFSLLQIAQIGSGIHPASYSMDTRAFSSRSKAVRHKIDHSPPPRTKLKMSAVINSTSHICLHGTQEQIYLFKGIEQKVVDWIQKSDK
jgi:hypothetical protein